MMANRTLAIRPAPQPRSTHRFRCAWIAAALVAAMAPVGAAVAQDARWQARSLEAEGRREKETCRKARAEAAEAARAHLGLNIKDCICRQAGAIGDVIYRCRLDFEVLVRE